MQPELKLIIYENEKVIHTVQKETFRDPQDLIKSLEEFRQAVNNKFTEIIEDDGRIGKSYDIGNVLTYKFRKILIKCNQTYDCIDDEISSSDDEKESIQHISPKKRKT